MMVVVLRRIEQMKVSSVPFAGTKEQEAKLLEVIAKYKGQKGALMPIMQEAQEIYGYLPYQVQKIISDETGIPIEKIYGVATFYAQFSMSPKGKYVVAVCLGTACYVKGSGAILEEVEKVLGIEDGGCTPDGKFSIEVCRCVGACGLAPVMIVGGDVYGKLTPDKVADILAKYE
jgi:NADH:ubiquinone oxidoreductase subunit E